MQEIFSYIVRIWILIAIILFPVLLKITAPYGRHSRASWGPMISNRMGWFIMELPALLIFSFLVIKGGNFHNTMVIIAFILWVTHYFHRAIIFPVRIKTKGKKMPVVIMALALFFNIVNGFINGYWFGYIAPGQSNGWLLDFRFLLGAVMFVLGFVINQYHDDLLIRLRKTIINDYKVPYGGLFKYISCPNFLGEIIEWGGFAILTWCLPSFSFFIWTIVNLIPRALDHHRWYLKNFTEYPVERKALIPFLL